jgi:hypothetical protein
LIFLTLKLLARRSIAFSLLTYHVVPPPFTPFPPNLCLRLLISKIHRAIFPFVVERLSRKLGFSASCSQSPRGMPVGGVQPYTIPLPSLLIFTAFLLSLAAQAFLLLPPSTRFPKSCLVTTFSPPLRPSRFRFSLVSFSVLAGSESSRSATGGGNKRKKHSSARDSREQKVKLCKDGRRNIQCAWWLSHRCPPGPCLVGTLPSDPWLLPVARVLTRLSMRGSYFIFGAVLS